MLRVEKIDYSPAFVNPFFAQALYCLQTGVTLFQKENRKEKPRHRCRLKPALPPASRLVGATPLRTLKSAPEGNFAKKLRSRKALKEQPKSFS